MLELLEDIIGISRAGLTCHPYKFKIGENKGKFVCSFDPEEKILYGVTEAELRNFIATGKFNDSGRIFMVPTGSKNVDRRSLLKIHHLSSKNY